MIEHLTTSGTFELAADSFDVENNVWIVGDVDEVILVDAPHDADAIIAAIGDRRLRAIVLTHGHSDHIGAAGAIADALSAPICLHAGDLELWRQRYPEREPDELLEDGGRFSVADHVLEVIHTPGHTPGGCCLYLGEDGVLFSGDTLFRGGPGATGRPYSDFSAIIESIMTRLLVLPEGTRVLTGHGAGTTIGDERPHLDEWIARGH